MSPWTVALRLMAQPDRPVGHPDFILAYLLEETARAGYDDPSFLSPHPHDQMRRHWHDIKQPFQRLARMLQAIDFPSGE